MTITIEQLVQREVLCCMSSLVSTIAQGYVTPQRGPGTRNIETQMRALEDLHTQAAELASPVLDYEEAARQAGYTQSDAEHAAVGLKNDIDQGNFDATYETWEEACDNNNIDPYEWEVYEFWAVSSWLAKKLIAQGERVDTDFASLNVWARTITGQAISADSVIEKIYKDMIAA